MKKQTRVRAEESRQNALRRAARAMGSGLVRSRRWKLAARLTGWALLLYSSPSMAQPVSVERPACRWYTNTAEPFMEGCDPWRRTWTGAVSGRYYQHETGIHVRRGEQLEITVEGRVCWEAGRPWAPRRCAGPEGSTRPGQVAWGLHAQIGPDPLLHVSQRSTTIVTDREGDLAFVIPEGGELEWRDSDCLFYGDNQGAYRLRIEARDAPLPDMSLNVRIPVRNPSSRMPYDERLLTVAGGRLTVTRTPTSSSGCCSSTLDMMTGEIEAVPPSTGQPFRISVARYPVNYVNLLRGMTEDVQEHLAAQPSEAARLQMVLDYLEGLADRLVETELRCSICAVRHGAGRGRAPPASSRPAQ